MTSVTGRNLWCASQRWADVFKSHWWRDFGGAAHDHLLASIFRRCFRLSIGLILAGKCFNPMWKMTGILSLSLYPLFVTSILYFSLLTEHCATQESCGIPPTSSSTLIRMAVSGCDWSMIDTISFMSHSPFCIFCFRSLSFSLAIFASCYCVHLLGGGYVCACMCIANGIY